MKNRLRMLSMVIVFAVGGISCSREGGDTVTLRFWALGSEGEFVRMLIPEFERTHPGIRVVTQQIPWTAAHEKLLTAYAGESTPDVCQIGNTWIPEFSVLQALEPLDPFVRNSPDAGIDDIFEGVLKMNVVDSVLYGIPWYVDTRVMYYRRDLLREAGFASPPATWDDMLKLCAVMKENARKKGRAHYPLFLPTNEWVPAIVFGVQAGGEFLKEGDTRGNFGGERFRKAFTLLADFYRREYSPSGQSLITNLYHSFSEGFIAMYITGPWNIGEFGRRVAPHLQDQWMTAPLPSMDATMPGASLPLGTSLVIFRQSRNKDAAWKLVEFLTSRDQSIRFYRITGNLPPRKSAWEDTSFTNNRYIAAFRRQLERVEPLPQVPEWEQIVIRLQLYVEYIATGRMSVDEAVRRFDDEVDRMLEKRRWLLTREDPR